MSDFNKKTWNTGETITADDLNRLEETMESVNASVNTLNSYNLDENVLNFGKRQTLSSVQQINARTNIGAMSIEAAEELNRKKLETSYKEIDNTPMVTLHDAADRLQYKNIEITISPTKSLVPLAYSEPCIGGVGNNIFNPNHSRTAYGFVTKKFLNVNGELVTNSNFHVSEYIMIEPNHTYYIGGLSTVLNTKITYDSTDFPSIVFYDSEKNYISGHNYHENSEDTSLSTSCVSPSTAEYCRITYTRQTNWQSQIYLNKTENAYSPYEFIINPPTLPNSIQLYQTKENLYGGDVLRIDFYNAFASNQISKWDYNEAENTIKFSAGRFKLNTNICQSMIFKENTVYTFIFTFASQVITDGKHYNYPNLPLEIHYTDGSVTSLRNTAYCTTDESTNIHTLLYSTDANKTIESIQRTAIAYTTYDYQILLLYLNNTGIFEGTINREDFKQYDCISTIINVPNLPNTYQLKYNLSDGWVIKERVGITLDGVTAGLRAEEISDEFRIGSIRTIVDSTDIKCSHLQFFPFSQRYEAPNFTLYQDNEGYVYFKAPDTWTVEDVNNLFISNYAENKPVIITYNVTNDNKIGTYTQNFYTRYGYSNVYCTNSYINKLTYPVDVFLNLNETWKFHPMIAERSLAENEYFQINNRLFKIIASGGVSIGSVIENGMYEETSIAEELNKLYSQEE